MELKFLFVAISAIVISTSDISILFISKSIFFFTKVARLVPWS